MQNVASLQWITDRTLLNVEVIRSASMVEILSQKKRCQRNQEEAEKATWGSPCEIASFALVTTSFACSYVFPMTLC